MRTRLVFSLFIALLFIATNASAQTRVGLAFAGLVSIQPIDESWVGSPYLDQGLGGVGPDVCPDGRHRRLATSLATDIGPARTSFARAPASASS